MAFCAAVVAFAGGCAVPSSSISSDSRPDPKLAYVYGRFFVHAEGKPGGLSSYPTIGMVIGCGHQQYEYTIRFLNTRDTVQLVPIYPGRCALMRMWRSDENGIPRGGGDLVPASPPFFDFEAGTAYYLGDYFAHAGIDYTYRNDRLKRYRDDVTVPITIAGPRIMADAGSTWFKILTRLNVTRAVREAERIDLIEQYEPPLNSDGRSRAQAKPEAQGKSEPPSGDQA